jgi:DNA-binding XRE family transcriptional regulator
MFNTDVFRVALAEVNKTQKQVATECGVHDLTISRIKKGMEPKVYLALKVAQAVNKKVEDLWKPGE